MVVNGEKNNESIRPYSFKEQKRKWNSTLPDFLLIRNMDEETEWTAIFIVHNNWKYEPSATELSLNDIHILSTTGKGKLEIQWDHRSSFQGLKKPK